MTKNRRVFNLTRGWTLKHKQAERAVDACSAAWVEYGVSIRDLTLAESIAARNKQARLREPLPYAEIFGLNFEPPVGGETGKRLEETLTWKAFCFAKNATATAA